MKLWKRRPLSEDLTRKDLNIPDEMPPTLVYISPGNQRISKRSSLTNNEQLIKFESTTELNSFQVTENENHSENKPCSRNHHLQSFRDCECKSSVQFDDNYPKSINLPNKDCKSYFAPVSLEWYPVKDVMKICRSASVPFHSRHQSSKTDMETTKVIETTELKSPPHLSLSEKIRIFFRNRSSSRPAKPALGKITEAKPASSPSNRNKSISRSSRSRMKDGERCKSLYESSRTSDTEYLQRLNNILKTNNSQSIYLSNGNGYTKQSLGNKDKKSDEKRLQSGKMEKVEKKCIDISDNQKRSKAQFSNSGSSQRVLVREFSSSVVSHTTSSAAKCRSPPPKTPETNPNYQKSKRHFEKNILNQTGEIFATNFKKKSSVIYDCPDFGTTDPSLSNRPSQVMIAPRSDKRNGNLAKPDVLSTRSARFDSRGYKQKSEYLLPRKLAPPILNSADLRAAIAKPQISDKNVDDEDDYVRLAEVITTPPPNCAFMTQSLYASYLPDYSSAILTSENNEVTIQKPQNYHSQQKDTILLKSKHRIQPVSGEIRKRPISCMAVVNADCRILPSDTDHSDRHGSNYPKSPYLSQYSKLYSLRTNGREMVNRYGYDMADTDLMSRSQHSGHYKMPVAISKDQTGKLSIDSGLVDDINASHSECIQQVQNY